MLLAKLTAKSLANGNTALTDKATMGAFAFGDVWSADEKNLLLYRMRFPAPEFIRTYYCGSELFTNTGVKVESTT
jgi:hypothetical protein